ncbi:MAG TPA: cyanophycin synthetase [bacterium]|nr:cyanophycin synthetase [bacterium]
MKYHFIGDQGISMRGLKEYMAGLGHQVSGSDIKSGGHKHENITSDIDIVVRTSAVSPGSPGWVEVEEAQKRGIQVIKRSELLGQITKGKKLIAVSGMHGKTTITAMIGLTLIEAGLDPTVIIGERLRELNDDVIRVGKSEWFVVEACEYDRSFLDLGPYIAIITNIEEEHLDTYPGGLPEIKAAFSEYLSKVCDNGAIIVCADDAVAVNVVSGLKTGAQIIPYGITTQDNVLGFVPALPGKHNLQNSLAVLSLARFLGLGLEPVRKVLSTFQGARRRFEIKGTFNGAVIIDDYGHHPSEIKATISGLVERYPDKKKVVIFWPHQYKRIQPLLSEFGDSFQGADEVILKPIYYVPGRDEILDVRSEDIAKLINEGERATQLRQGYAGQEGRKARVVQEDGEIVDYLKTIADKDTVILTIGIPPVYKIAEALAGEARQT